MAGWDTAVSGPYLRPTYFIDSDHPDVIASAGHWTGRARRDVSKAVRLFYAVRDHIAYDFMDALELGRPRFKASAVLNRDFAFCIPKAVLLTAACRAVGVPCRLRFADVRNHLSTERIRRLMASDVFLFHGLVEMHLAGRWVKATPAFDRAFSERHGVRPIEFDGKHDAIFHEFDVKKRKHLEYVKDHGPFADLPYGRIVRAFRTNHPRMYGGS